MKFSIKDFFSKCDQIRIFLRIWSHLLKKSLTENLIFITLIAFDEIYCVLSKIKNGLQISFEKTRETENNAAFFLSSFEFLMLW